MRCEVIMFHCYNSIDNISDETHMVIENDDGANSSAVTGITHEHPFAWALDGRLTSSIESNTSGRGINVSAIYHKPLFKGDLQSKYAVLCFPQFVLTRGRCTGIVRVNCIIIL